VLVVHDVETWIALGAVLLLIILTVQMRRHRRKLKARRDGSEAEREPEGGP
jgi:hypothetical protein